MSLIIRKILCLFCLIFCVYGTAQSNNQVDKTCLVGEIPIEAGVSAFGARTYTVPIDVYPGMNGLTPSLSFIYNSQQGITTLGHGWSIGGLSMITRVSKDIYHDGVVASVTTGAEDAFCLDGIRLMEQSKDYNVKQFETEQGNIKAVAHLSDTIITHFEVFYPDGSKGIFGDPQGNKRHVFYPITQLSDLQGNTIQFDYKISNNYYYIDKIAYNGDAAVEFEYLNQRPDRQYIYLGSFGVGIYKLLSKVKCKLGSVTLCEYGLEYETKNTNSLLSKISYVVGEDSYNPLKFEYGDNYASSSYRTSTTTISGDYHLTSTQALKIIKGRFDIEQDKEGVITTPNKNPYYNHYRNSTAFRHSQNRFLNQYGENQTILAHLGLENSKTTVLPALKTGAGFVDLLCADLRGKCRDCIIKINNVVNNNLDEVTFQVYENSGRELRNTLNRTYSFETVTKDGDGYNSIQPKFYYPGDFNGDGKMEILAISAHQALGSSSPVSSIYIFDLLNDSIVYQESIIPYTVKFLGSNVSDPVVAEKNSDKFFVLDCDGDGKTDFCYVNSKGLYAYTFDQTPSGLQCRRMSFLANVQNILFKERQLIPGDFNGDGIADLVMVPTDSVEKWGFIYGRGKGFYSYSQGNAEKQMVPNETTSYYIADVNNDGISDILFVNKDKSHTTGYDKLCTHIVKNFNFSESILENLRDYNEQIIPLDINIRPRRSALIGVCDDIISKYIFKRDESRDLCISEMTNSLGVRQENAYEAINSDSPIYSSGTGTSFPYANIAMGKTVLSASKTYQNEILVDSESYNYENAVVNLQGLGFCGFEKITKKNLHEENEVSQYIPTCYGVLKSTNSPRAKSQYTYDVDHRQYGLTKIRLTKKSDEDLIKGIRSTTEYAYDSYGYPILECVDIENYGSIAKTVSYESHPYVNRNSIYSLGLPISEVTKTTVNGTSYETKVLWQYTRRLPIKQSQFINGNRVSEQSYTYDASGNQLSSSLLRYTSNDRQVTTYEYDAYGRVVNTTDPLGFCEEYTYDSYGRKASVKDRRGNIINYTYDSFGQLISEVHPDGVTTTVLRDWTAYGESLYSITTSSTGKPVVRESYDALNRLVEKSEQRFDGGWLKSYRQYDKYGNLSASSLPTKSNSVQWTTYKYDKFDRLCFKIEPFGKRTEYDYDYFSESVFTEGIFSKKTFNPRGEVIAVDDPSGRIEYFYGPDGQIENIVTPDGQETIINYDEYRRRISISDPNVGLIEYEYDDNGNVISEEINGFDYQAYEYDKYDRLIWKQIDVSEYNYAYNEFGELQSVSDSGGVNATYTYDSFGRLNSNKELYGNRAWLEKNYTYDNGNISAVSYETDKGHIATEKYFYTNGHLSEIRLNDRDIVYKLADENDLGLTSRLKTGDFVREYGYEANGLPSWRRASHPNLEVQNYSYNFDPETSNLNSRSDSISGRNESFTYDYQNRLTSWNGGEAEYDIMGSIVSRSDVGVYGYTDPDHPYAVTQISDHRGELPFRQSVSYYFSGHPSDIVEKNIWTHFEYNVNLDRVYSVTRNQKDKKITTERYYFGNCYEREAKLGSPVEERLYLGGDYYNAVAVLIKTDDSEELHYIFRDYLGSVTQLCKADGTLVQELEYSPWGEVSLSDRSPKCDDDSIVIPRIGRGFTGHEHLPYYGLINMNARLYDPVLGRFLSPDPLVQSPDWSQNFNGYTYAMNNPLRYVDEDGESIIAAIAIGALIGGAINVATNWDAICEAGGGWSSVWKATQYFGIGAVAGGAGGAVAAVMPAAIGFMPGMMSGMASGAAEGFLLGFGNSSIDGSSFGSALGDGLTGGLTGALGGGICGGAMGAAQAHAMGRNVWTGEVVRSKNLQVNLNLSHDGLDFPICDVRPTPPDDKIYSVYMGFDENGTVRYVGSTKREPLIRFKEHWSSETNRSNLRFVVYESNLTKMEARIWEQQQINFMSMEKNKFGQLFNLRNEIANKYWQQYKISPPVRHENFINIKQLVDIESTIVFRNPL